MIERTVAAVGLQSPPTVTPETPVRDAAQSLRNPAVSALVVHDGDAVVGILTESDIVAVVAETDERPAVGTVMSTPVRTVSPTATLAEAATRMRSAGVRQLPVTSDGSVVGLLSAETLAPYCSRRSLDIEWADEPLRVDGGDRGGVVADN